MRWLVALVLLLPSLAVAGESEVDRTLDFHGGYTLRDTPAPSLFGSMPGVRLDTRYFVGPWFASGRVDFSFMVDGRNVEDGEEVGILGLGLGGGALQDVGPWVTLSESVHVEWVNAWDLPVGAWPERTTVHDGVRVTPEVAVSLWLGTLFDHPVGLTVAGGYEGYWLGPVQGHGWTATLSISTILLPDPWSDATRL